MTFILGSTSRRNLIGVHPALVDAVERAISLTRVDFQVFDGVRAIDEQRANLARGVSWTLNSRHLPQPDGFGHAVDLVPIIGAKLAWDWDGCVVIAHAMARAASLARISLRWGGMWDLPLTTYSGSETSIRAASQAYVERRRRAGKRASLDGPHFELLDALTTRLSGRVSRQLPFNPAPPVPRHRSRRNPHETLHTGLRSRPRPFRLCPGAVTARSSRPGRGAC